jgi:hypothetical protein
MTLLELGIAIVKQLAMPTLLGKALLVAHHF